MMFAKKPFFNYLRMFGIILLIFTFTLPFQILTLKTYVFTDQDPLLPTTTAAHSKMNVLTPYPLPFNGMVMNYLLLTSVPEYGIQIPANLTISFFNNSPLPTNYKNNYDYAMKLIFRILVVSTSDNFTFYINKNSRQMTLDSNKTQSIYLANYISLIYNDSSAAVNYVPFWIVPYNLTIGSQYPIYSFNFTIVSNFATDFHDFLGIRRVLEARVNNFIVNPVAQANLTNNLSALYDYQTGILLKGYISSQINWYNGTTKKYTLDFSLIGTNAFSMFPGSLNSTNSLNVLQLPPTNYIILFIAVGLPILVTVVSFLRIRRIDGGV